MTTWVFGYGSLVSRTSLGQTLGRDVAAGVGWAEAIVAGYGRRWNYGVGHTRGHWVDDAGRGRDVTLVALGVIPSRGESTNGIVVAVDDHELARLDRRERHYDRVDVTVGVGVLGDGGPVDGDVVVTYVPRPIAIERYERARDRSAAAIEQRYWDLVTGAFAVLGADRLATYHDTTPSPDVPVRQVERIEPA